MTIKMEKYSKQKEDIKFREMLASTKIEAPENLKHRIMQQIETEKAFAPQNVEPKKNRRIC